MGSEHKGQEEVGGVEEGASLRKHAAPDAPPHPHRYPVGRQVRAPRLLAALPRQVVVAGGVSRLRRHGGAADGGRRAALVGQLHGGLF